MVSIRANKLKEISAKSDCKTLRFKDVFAELPCKKFLVRHRASLAYCLSVASVLACQLGPCQRKACSGLMLDSRRSHRLQNCTI